MNSHRIAQAVPAYVPGHDLLAGRTVVITAAAGAGIGSSAALRCLEEGAKAVVIGDVHERRLAEVAGRLRRQFGDARVASAVCDVRKESEVAALLDAAEPYGGVDVLINNAGLGIPAPLLEMTDEQWATSLDVTLTGTFRCIRAAARRMVQRGAKGAIVNNASILGWRAEAGMLQYSSAKAGVMALTRGAAKELSGHGIRVNCVAPSFVANPFLIKASTQEALDEALRNEAFGRSAEPWEVANVMIFLASDYASYMTGEIVSVSCQHP